jgi:hypothetical protein
LAPPQAHATALALATQLRAWQPRNADALATLLLTLRGAFRAARRACRSGCTAA